MEVSLELLILYILCERHEGSLSEKAHLVPQLSGVPQGSVLGPLLFLLYIDSLSHLQLSPGSKMVLYADDVLLYRSIYLINDYYSLQGDINKIFNWSTNFLTLNPSKCKYPESGIIYVTPLYN